MTWITPYHRISDFTDLDSIDTKITIFKEQTLGWQLCVADACINGKLPEMRHSGWAVLMIAFSYFEMIAKTRAGYEGMSDSKRYSTEGICDVFPWVKSLPEDQRKDLLAILYNSVRCGFYHAGMTHGRVRINGDYPNSLEYDANTGRVLINPHKFIPELKEHFLRFIEQLNDPVNVDLRTNFIKRYDFMMNLDPLANKHP